MAATSLTVPNALAARRAIATAGALAATIAAHALATGELDLTRTAPAAWLGILAAAVLLGGRRRWRARGVVGSLGLMLLMQAGAHVVLSLAPWAAGLAPHHDTGLALTPVALAAHAGTAVALAFALARLEVVLEAAMGVVAAVRRRLAAHRRPAPPRPQRISIHPTAWSGRPAPRVRACRGPPRFSPA